ncbi:MAG: hypothetical protein ACK4GJ_05370 [bacterium]
MILTELSEEELKESEKKIRNEIKFLLSKLLNLSFYLLAFLLLITYIFVLSEKNKMERTFSSNQEILKNLDNDIKIHKSLLTTYTSVEHISKVLGIKRLYLPSEIWFIYDVKMVKIKGD